MKILKRVLVLSIILILQISCAHEEEKNNVEKMMLENWKIINSKQLKINDEELSKNYNTDSNWIDATVPTTVLRALVKAGVYPDPHFDLNNFKIPDASDELNKRLDLENYSYLKQTKNPFKEPYWFRTQFRIPKEDKNKNVWLNFDGINYRADIWLNGKKIADSSEVVGMFRRFKFNITDFQKLDSINTLAVKIYQVDQPGTPNPGYQFEVFGPTRGHGKDIFKYETLKFSAGWDCAPVVRDRNMGIYQDVFLTFTDAVDIIDPNVITDLSLPDTTIANLTISAELFNSSKNLVKGILKGRVNLQKEIDFYTYTKVMPGEMIPINFEKEVEIPAGKTINVNIQPKDYPQLSIKNPYLWWPNGYGNQYLYNLKLEFIIDGKTSDIENTTFGIREITNTFKEINGEFGRVFWVNGKRIFIRGGWIQPDMMLDMNKKRMYDEVRLLANANINMIGSEDMPSPPDYLMDIYDKYGLLVWETFYQCWRMYPGTESFKNPIDTKLALEDGYDIVKRYRSHPSLAIWAVANEVTVRQEIYSPLRNYIKQMDTTRPFIPTSSYDWDVDKLTPFIKQDLPLGMTDDGPPDYTWYPHKYYYDKILEVKQQMFRNELGVPSVPTFSSMKKFMFDLGEGNKNDAIYPLNKNWAHHGAWDLHGYAFRAYDKAIRDRYGEPKSAEEYINNAQFVNAGSYRAMFEAANHRMWNITSGVMIWKLNSCWPTVLWQIYDWFLNPNSAYYFTKKALEPLHIQLNENDLVVSVINATHKEHKNLEASVKVVDFNLKTVWGKDTTFSIDEDRYEEIFKLPKINDLTPVYYVKLNLKDKNGKIISDNFYWLSSKDEIDFRDLAKLEKINLDVKQNIIEKGNEYLIKLDVKNPTDKIAFFNRLKITKGLGGEEIFPTFWSDNFFTLFPGESKTVTARFAQEDLDNKKPFVAIE